MYTFSCCCCCCCVCLVWREMESQLDRARESQRQQIQQADSALEQFKKQVELSAEKTYAEVKLQVGYTRTTRTHTRAHQLTRSGILAHTHTHTHLFSFICVRAVHRCVMWMCISACFVISCVPDTDALLPSFMFASPQRVHLNAVWQAVTKTMHTHTHTHTLLWLQRHSLTTDATGRHAGCTWIPPYVCLPPLSFICSSTEKHTRKIIGRALQSMHTAP